MSHRLVAREGFEARKPAPVSANLDTSDGPTDEIVAQHPPKVGGLVQPLDQPLRVKAVAEAVDPVEAALSTALAAAATAGQWSVVETLARELEARRMARAALQPADVIDLGDEKRRRRR